MSKFLKLVQKQKFAKEIKKQHFNLEAKTNANRGVTVCACGSQKAYTSCCRLIHHNIHLANSPLSLMKSRYTAYVLGNIDFLMRSHHSSTRPTNEKEAILAWTNSITWLRLEIIEETVPTNEVGYVTFIASYLEKGQQNRIYETSRFLKEDKHWVYVDGTHL